MENYPDKSDDIKVEIEALELLVDQEDSEVCLRCNLTHARRQLFVDKPVECSRKGGYCKDGAACEQQ